MTKENKVYKLQIHLEDPVTEELMFRVCYLDVSKITGFYIPDDIEGSKEKSINVFFDGDLINIKQEPHILNYLRENFVNNCISITNYE